MKLAFSRSGLLLIFAISLALIVGAVMGSAGFYIIDELVYFIGAESFRGTGGFAVENGFEQFGSDDLKIWLLVEGPNGIVPQYPPGSAIAGAALLGIFGTKALIALNVAAGIGTLFVTYSLARRMFQSTEAASLSILTLAACTFWAEYTFAHWPHSISIFLVNAAFLLFLVGLDAKKPTYLPAFLSGAVAGIGLFFRLEGMLLLLAMTIATIFFAKNPIKTLLAGSAGFLPLAALLALINNHKFGVWNPITYGNSSGGGTDVSSYLSLLMVGALGVVGLVVLRRVRESVRIDSRIVVAVLFLGLIALSYFVPAFGKFGTGAWAILVDSTTIHDSRVDVVKQPDGTMLFWGVPKKALGQSLPWLGCLAMLIGLHLRDKGRSVALLLILIVVWSLPFLMRSWHGGLGSNMRYLLPTLPALSILAAWVMLQLREYSTIQRPILLTGTIALFTTTTLLLGVPQISPAIHQIASKYLLATIAVTSVMAGLFPRATTTNLTLATIGFGLGMSGYLAFQDTRATQERRHLRAERSEAAKAITGRTVIYAPPANVAFAFGNPDQLVALPHPFSGKVDLAFLRAACDENYRIVATEFIAEHISAANADLNIQWLDSPLNGSLTRAVDCQTLAQNGQ